MNILKLRYIAIVLLCWLLPLGAAAQDQGDTRLLEAVQAYSSGNLTQAASRFEALVKADPSLDAAWYYLGL